MDEITASVPLDERVIALDRVLANIDTSQIIPKNVEGVKADPPPIFFSKTPAVLVNIDGDPIWAPIPQNDLKSAVNTNWDLFQHGPTKTFYLRNEQVWLKATDVKGPWGPAGTLPESFKKLPADDNWKEVKASLPGQTISASQAPKVFVSTAAGGDDSPARRAELPGGPGRDAAAVGQQHRERRVPHGPQRARSTSSSRAAGSRRPISPGPGRSRRRRLPAEFKKIPLEHAALARAGVGAGHARRPPRRFCSRRFRRRRRVSKTLQAPEVAYQGGTPQFQPIEKTTVQRAVNTDKDIIKVGDLYYMCFQGVWFMSTDGDRPVEGHRRGAEADLRDSGELAVPRRHLRHRGGVERRRRGLRDGGGVHRRDGRVRLRRVGHRLLLPAVLRVLRRLPVLLPALSDLRVRRVVQPVDRRVHARRGGLRSVRRRRRRRSATTRGPAPTRAARWPTVRTARAARRRPTTRAPARTARPGRARTSTAAGARPACSAAIKWAATARTTNNVTGVTRRAARETSGGGAAVSRTGPGGTHGGRAGPAAATSTPATTATSTASRATAGRSTTTAAGATSSSRRRSSASRRRTARAGRHAGGTRRQLGLGFGDGRPGEPRLRGAGRGARRTRDASSARSGGSTSSGSYRASGAAAGARAGGGRRR